MTIDYRELLVKCLHLWMQETGTALSYPVPGPLPPFTDDEWPEMLVLEREAIARFQEFQAAATAAPPAYTRLR